MAFKGWSDTQLKEYFGDKDFAHQQIKERLGTKMLKEEQIRDTSRPLVEAIAKKTSQEETADHVINQALSQILDRMKLNSVDEQEFKAIIEQSYVSPDLLSSVVKNTKKQTIMAMILNTDTPVKWIYFLMHKQPDAVTVRATNRETLAYDGTNWNAFDQNVTVDINGLTNPLGNPVQATMRNLALLLLNSLADFTKGYGVLTKADAEFMLDISKDYAYDHTKGAGKQPASAKKREIDALLDENDYLGGDPGAGVKTKAQIKADQQVAQKQTADQRLRDDFLARNRGTFLAQYIILLHLLALEELDDPNVDLNKYPKSRHNLAKQQITDSMYESLQNPGLSKLNPDVNITDANKTQKRVQDLSDEAVRLGINDPNMLYDGARALSEVEIILDDVFKSLPTTFAAKKSFKNQYQPILENLRSALQHSVATEEAKRLKLPQDIQDDFDDKKKRALKNVDGNPRTTSELKTEITKLEDQFKAIGFTTVLNKSIADIEQNGKADAKGYKKRLPSAGLASAYVPMADKDMPPVMKGRKFTSYGDEVAYMLALPSKVFKNVQPDRAKIQKRLTEINGSKINFIDINSKKKRQALLEDFDKKFKGVKHGYGMSPHGTTPKTRGSQNPTRNYKLDPKTSKFGALNVDMNALNNLHLIAKDKDNNTVLDRYVDLDFLDLLLKRRNSKREYSGSSIDTYQELTSKANIPINRTSKKLSQAVDLHKSPKERLERFKNILLSKRAGNWPNTPMLTEAMTILSALLKDGVISESEFVALNTKILE